MSDLEILRRELLERGDEMISFQQFVERFDSVEKEFGNTPWNLKQIYSNFNILTGEKSNKWIPVSERLPEIHQDVLLSLRSLDVEVGFRAETEPYFYCHNADGCYIEPQNVLAWMPLPEKYKASPTVAERSDKE